MIITDEKAHFYYQGGLVRSKNNTIVKIIVNAIET